MKIFLLQILFLILAIPIAQAQSYKTDSLANQLKSVLADTSRVNLLNVLAYQVVDTDPSQAFQYAEKALALAEKVGFSRGKAASLFNVGYYHKVKGNYSTALVYSFKALTIYEMLGDKKGMADGYNLVAIVSYTKDNRTELSYFSKALDLYQQIDDWTNVAKVYGNLGDMYSVQGKNDKALQYLFKGVAISQKSHDDSMLGFCFSLIGQAYGRQGKYPEALSYSKKSLEIFNRLHDKTFMTYALDCLGGIYYKMNRPSESLLHYNQALDSAQKFGFKEQIKLSAEGLSKTYAGMHNYQKAYEYQRLYIATRDLLLEQDSTLNLSNLRAGYELDKRQAKISLLQKDQQIKAKETETQQTFIYFLLACSALGLSVSFLIWRSFRQTKKINELLRAQKEDTERQKKSVSEQNAALEETNRELFIAKEKAEAASKAKADFLSTMSHEIRTPMNAVLGLTYLLIQEEPKPQQLNHLNTLRFSAENLLALINDILDFSKIEAGKIHLEAIDFDIRELVGSIRDAQAIRSNDKGISLHTVWDDHIPRTVGDPIRLGQVLTNLISNSIKFTEQGGVKVEVRLLAQREQRVTLRFSVIDTGIGIPADKMDDIFESFTQAHAHTTRIFGGTGLGLAITKKLLTLMGSQIQVESEPEKGSCFSFELSMAVSKTVVVQAKNSVANTQTGFKLKGVRILLVDDHDINLLIASTFLKKWDVEVDTAENGLIALEKVRNNTYDAVLMDLQMPVMDGYEAAAAIRQLAVIDPYYQTLPIFALTADAMADVKNKVLAAGMNDYVTKPFVPNELYQKIVKYTLGQLTGMKL